MTECKTGVETGAMNRIRIALISAAVAMSAVAIGVVGVGSASAEEIQAGIQCGGKVVPKGDDAEYPYEYEFKCDRDLRGFSIVSNREVDATISEPIGLGLDGEPAIGEDFFCISSIPGWGFSCYGRRGTAKLTAGNTMKAGLSTFEPICDANDQPQFWIVPVYEYTEENTTVTPPTTAKWLVAAEPVALGNKEVRCKVLNPKAKAKEACAKAKRAKPGTKAKTMAQAKCRKAQAAVRASR